MQISTTTGLISWDQPDQLGTFPVRISADDGHGGTSEQAFTLSVVPAASANTGPSFTSVPKLTAKVSGDYSYQVTAADVDGDNFAITVDPAHPLPSWLILDSTNTLHNVATITPSFPTHIYLIASDGNTAVDAI